MNITICGLASVLLIATTTQLQGLSQSTRHSLDLLPTSSDERPQNARRWLGPPPVADSGVVPTFPFAIKIVSLDRTAYDLGDDIIYELELNNISRRTVAVPWLADSSAVTPKMPGATALQLSLLFSDSLLGRHYFGFRWIYGAESVPGSLRQIAPGDTIEIRAQAPLRLMQAWSANLGEKWVRTVDLKVHASLAVAGQPNTIGTSPDGIQMDIRGR